MRVDCIFVLGILVPGRIIAQQEVDVNSPKGVIAYLTASLRTHGLAERFLDEETKRILDIVVQNPAPYMDSLSESLKVPTAFDEASLEGESCRIANTLYLAQLIGPRHAGASIRAFFDWINDRLQAERAQDRTRNRADRDNGANLISYCESSSAKPNAGCACRVR